MIRFAHTFILLLVVPTLCAHPIKMTTGKLFFNPEKQTAELLINFFIDDFSAHLSDTYFTELTYENIAADENRELIMDYISKNVLIFEESQKIELKLDNTTAIEENVLQVRLELPDFDFFADNKIKIVNTLLFDAFDNQTNVLQIEQPGKKKPLNFRFIRRSPTYTFNLGK